ncbi:MAG: GNAT family N-acetyltransferase [Dehalococcoidales bacterium]
MPKSDIKRVPVEQAIELMKELIGEHWKEVPFGDYQLELNLDIPTYCAVEASGHGTCLVAYIEDTIVGYMLLLASSMLHHEGLHQVITDSFYVVPEYRDAGVFLELLTAAETLCKADNLDFLSLGLNPQYPENATLEDYVKEQGYSLTELTYTKSMK